MRHDKRRGYQWVVLGIFAATFLLADGCATTSPVPVSPSYSAQMKAVTAGYEHDSHPVDTSITYSPGIVRKTLPEDVVVDPDTGAERVRDEYIVALRPGNTDLDFLRILPGLGIDGELVGYVPTFRMVQLHAPRLDAQHLQAIRGLPMVDWVAVNHVQKTEQTTATARKAAPWYLETFGIAGLQALGDGHGVRIAIIDSGLDVGLASFADRIVDPYSVVTTSSVFEDHAYTSGGNVTRVIDHGTRVASMAGVVAPGAHIIPLQVFGWSVQEGKLLCNDLAIVEALARAIADGAQVINLSVGTDYSRFIRYGEPLPDDQGQARQAMKKIGHDGADIYTRVLGECQSRNILVVCSAGNEGVDDASVQPLVATGLTIVAGAIGRDGVMAGFSNRGRMVDCFAPGVDCDLEGAGATRFAVSGTSFSSPFVAGVLALARSANLEIDARSAKRALRDSNFQGRLSILPAQPNPVFYPAALFRGLGAQVPSDDSPISAQYMFARRYRSLFIDAADSEPTWLDRILRYYAFRGWAFEESDAEYQAALARAPRNIPMLVQRVVENESGDYIAAVLLSDIELPPDVLTGLVARIGSSDYVALVVAAKDVRQAIPGLHERLRRGATEFNSNTLSALGHFGDPSSLPVVESYLRERQGATSFERGEELACTTLITLAGGHPDPEGLALLNRSWDRYQDVAADQWFSPDGYWDNILVATRMVENQVLMRDARGLVEAARLLRLLDSLERPIPAAEDETRVSDADWNRFSGGRQRGIESLQSIVNEYLPNALKYDHLADQSDRRRMLSHMASFFESFHF